MDDTTLITESKEELKKLLMRVKEESEKASLKLSIKKTKFMASSLITSWQIEGRSSCGQVQARDAQVSGVSVFLLLQSDLCPKCTFLT